MEFIFIWNIDPEILNLGFLSLRWYGLLFATAFLLSSFLGKWIFIRENQDLENLDRLIIYMMLGTVIGARLGHCLFYEPIYYLSNPLEILKVWKGGLASHGAGIGIFFSIYLYSRKTVEHSYLWVIDRCSIITVMSGFFIRLGNFFNSEIIGQATGSNWGVVFKRVDNLPRHPAQLYESLSYLVIFIILLMVYIKSQKPYKNGQITGLFLLLTFGMRFIIELVKENQSFFEESWVLNLGQLLSIPMMIIGVSLIIISRRTATT